MKIVKQGVAPNTLRGTCHRCGCVIECRPDECYHVPREPAREPINAVNCPMLQCGSIVYPKGAK